MSELWKLGSSSNNNYNNNKSNEIMIIVKFKKYCTSLNIFFYEILYEQYHIGSSTL